MRSFSKKLAFVLAAAMVVTAFAPAAKAEAAKEMAINKSSQILYVNEGINHKGADGVAAGKGNVSVYDFSVKNKPADWKTAYSFAWSSSDEDVVSVAKGGVATAVGVGKATVYCKVTEKATKEVTTLKTKVTVKANAYDVEITNADKWDGATVEVNGVVDLNRAMYDEDGNKTTKRGTLVTDYTQWVAEPAAGVEIDQKTGKFTFTEAAVAGEYKLSCYTYQSSKYTKATATSDAVVVEFVNGGFEVDQTASNAFNLLFNKAADLKIADVTVNKIIKVGASNGKLPMVVNNVAMSEDKKTASVSLFSNFENGATYEISVKGYDEAATLTAVVGKPVSLTVSSKSGMQNGVFVYTNTPTELTYFLYDEQGNDVTNTATGYVIYTAANASTDDYYVSDNSICITKEGTEVVVNAEYHNWEYNDKVEEQIVKGSGFFVGVAKAPESIKSITVTPKLYGNPFPNNQIPLNDKNTVVEVKIQTTKWDDTYPKAYMNNASVLPLDETGKTVVRFRTSNPDVLDINSTQDWEGNDVDQIALFKEGTAAILVDLVVLRDDGTVKSSETIAATYVTVVAKRAVTSFNIDGLVTIGTEAPFNVESIKISAKDQYGSDVEIHTIREAKIVDNAITTDVSGALELISRAANNYQGNKLNVSSEVADAVDFPTDKNEKVVNVVMKVVAGDPGNGIDNVEKELRFRALVKRPAGAAMLDVEATDTTSGNVGRFANDNPYDNSEAEKKVTFKVFTKQNGIKVEQEEVAQKLYNTDANAASAGALFYTVTHDGVDITHLTTIGTDGKTITLKYSTTASNAGQFNVINAEGNVNYTVYETAGKKLGAGNYVFTLYKVVENKAGTKNSFAYVDSATTNVSVDAGSYSFVKRVTEKIDEYTVDGVTYAYDVNNEQTPANIKYGIWSWDNLKALRFAFEFKDRNGNTVGKDALFSVDAKDDVNQTYVHVNSVTFYEALGDGTYAPYTVKVNTSLVK